jgi:hypothetical protein
MDNLDPRKKKKPREAIITAASGTAAFWTGFAMSRTFESGVVVGLAAAVVCALVILLVLE